MICLKVGKPDIVDRDAAGLVTILWTRDHDLWDCVENLSPIFGLIGCCGMFFRDTVERT